MQWCTLCISSCTNQQGPNNGSQYETGIRNINLVHHLVAALSDLNLQLVTKCVLKPAEHNKGYLSSGKCVTQNTFDDKSAVVQENIGAFR